MATTTPSTLPWFLEVRPDLYKGSLHIRRPLNGVTRVAPEVGMRIVPIESSQQDGFQGVVLEIEVLEEGSLSESETKLKSNNINKEEDHLIDSPSTSSTKSTTPTEASSSALPCINNKTKTPRTQYRLSVYIGEMNEEVSRVASSSMPRAMNEEATNLNSSESQFSIHSLIRVCPMQLTCDGKFITIPFFFPKWNSYFFDDTDELKILCAEADMLDDVLCRECYENESDESGKEEEKRVVLVGVHESDESDDDKKKKKRVLEPYHLPSALWDSFADCIACEECFPYRNSRFPARQGRIYWSKLYGLVHKNDVIDHSLIPSSDKEKEKEESANNNNLEEEDLIDPRTLLEMAAAKRQRLAEDDSEEPLSNSVNNIDSTHTTNTTTNTTTNPPRFSLCPTTGLCLECGSRVSDPPDSDGGMQLYKHKIWMESGFGSGINAFAEHSDESCVGLILREALQTDMNRLFRLEYKKETSSNSKRSANGPGSSFVESEKERRFKNLKKSTSLPAYTDIRVVAKNVKVLDLKSLNRNEESRARFQKNPKLQEKIFTEHILVWYKHSKESIGESENLKADSEEANNKLVRHITIRDAEVFGKVIGYLEAAEERVPHSENFEWKFGYLPVPPTA